MAESGPFTFPEDSLPVIPTNIPVQPGDRLGLFTGNPPIPSSYESIFEDDVLANAIGFPEVGDTLGPTGDFSRTFSDFTRANVSAVLTGPAGPAPEASCKGTAATVIGTDGADELSGTDSRDVIAGLGGRDEIRGLAGRDLICGGKGRDTLRGGKGKDKLYGQKGKDKLVGGGGKDRCVGGKKDDTAKKCEVEKSI